MMLAPAASVIVSAWPAWIVAGCAIGTFALCLWSIPHHRKHR